MAGVEAYVAVGSNIAPAEHILGALDALRRVVEIRNASRFYQTRPVERPDQDDYRNGVFSLQTAMLPRDLKYGVLRPIEDQMGRVRTDDAYAARTIDLDLIVYGDRHEISEDLRLPDPDIRIRPFIAVPLLELAPELCLPDTRERLAEVVARMDATLQLDPELSERIQARLRNE